MSVSTSTTSKKNPISALTDHVRSSRVYKLATALVGVVLYSGIALSNPTICEVGLAGFTLLLVAAYTTQQKRVSA